MIGERKVTRESIARDGATRMNSGRNRDAVSKRAAIIAMAGHEPPRCLAIAESYSNSRAKQQLSIRTRRRSRARAARRRRRAKPLEGRSVRPSTMERGRLARPSVQAHLIEPGLVLGLGLPLRLPLRLDAWLGSAANGAAAKPPADMSADRRNDGRSEPRRVCEAASEAMRAARGPERRRSVGWPR